MPAQYHTKKIRDESYGYNQYGEKTTINDLMNAGDKTSITFDANGNQLQRSVTNDGKTNTSTFAYEKWDSYKQQSTTQPFDSGHKKIQDTIGLQHCQYDANGNVKDLQDATGRRSFEYITDINGQVLSRSESEYNTTTRVWENKRQNFFYFDGRTIGEAGDFTSANKDFVRMNSEATEGYTKAENIKNSTADIKGQGAQKDQQSANFIFGYGGVNPYTSSVGYTTNVEGETAKTIAQSVYGDSSLWHVIAEANGISGTDGLPKGTSIRVPEAVYSVKSTAQNLGVTQGDTLGNAQPLVPDSPRINDGSWDNEIQLAITIVIEVVAVVAAVAVGVLSVWTGPGAALAAAGTYATIKQVGNNAAGRQDGWNWGQFAYDAVSYYAASGVGGTASGVKQVAITATRKAAVDHGFSKATDGKYGQDFTWENYLTSFATSYLSSKVAPAGSAGENASAWEVAGRKLGNSAANGLVSDTIRRNTYGSYDADKETGLNFLERTLQSTSTSLANDAGEALAKSSLQSYYGDEKGQRLYDESRERRGIAPKVETPDWISSTLDFLGGLDLQTPTEQPKNALTAEQKDTEKLSAIAEQERNESLRESADLLNLENAQASLSLQGVSAELGGTLDALPANSDQLIAKNNGNLPANWVFDLDESNAADALGLALDSGDVVTGKAPVQELSFSDLAYEIGVVDAFIEFEDGVTSENELQQQDRIYNLADSLDSLPGEEEGVSQYERAQKYIESYDNLESAKKVIPSTSLAALQATSLQISSPEALKDLFNVIDDSDENRFYQYLERVDKLKAYEGINPDGVKAVYNNAADVFVGTLTVAGGIAELTTAGLVAANPVARASVGGVAIPLLVTHGVTNIVEGVQKTAGGLGKGDEVNGLFDEYGIDKFNAKRLYSEILENDNDRAGKAYGVKADAAFNAVGGIMAVSSMLNLSSSFADSFGRSFDVINKVRTAHSSTSSFSERTQAQYQLLVDTFGLGQNAISIGKAFVDGNVYERNRNVLLEALLNEYR